MLGINRFELTSDISKSEQLVKIDPKSKTIQISSALFKDMESSVMFQDGVDSAVQKILNIVMLRYFEIMPWQTREGKLQLLLEAHNTLGLELEKRLGQPVATGILWINFRHNILMFGQPIPPDGKLKKSREIFKQLYEKHIGALPNYK